MAIVKAAGLIMKAIVEEGTPEMAEKMQRLSLAEGSLPRHLHTALFTQSLDNRLLTHRQLSRHLVGLWLVNNATGLDLLRRILPTGLLDCLESKEEVGGRRDVGRPLGTRGGMCGTRLFFRPPMCLVAVSPPRAQVPDKDVDRMHVRDTVKIAMGDKSKKAARPLVQKKLNELMLHWRARSGNKAAAQVGAPAGRSPMAAGLSLVRGL